MGKSTTVQEREPTAQEMALWEQQANYAATLANVAQQQLDLSAEDRTYYEEVFRNGTDTQAREAIAKLQSQITGQTVDPNSITGVNMDQLLRDTLLTATPEIQQAASQYIDTANQLNQSYGQDVTGLSSTFATGIQDLTNNYTQELQTMKEQAGTINQDILSRETGAAMGGISTSYAEARKQLEGSLAQRGLAGSGVEATLLANTYNQEALAKAGAAQQARGIALQQSEALRTQQATLGAQQLQAGITGLGTAYNAQLGASQSIYGAATQTLASNYQQQQAATMQGIANLAQGAAAGAGLYAGAQNYLAQAGASAGAGMQSAGSAATGLAGVNSQYALGVMQADASSSAGIGSLVGTLGGAYLLSGRSDERLKTNIKFVEEDNGFNIYTWDWVEGFDGGYNKGVIAQEVLHTNPEAVMVDEDGYLIVDYGSLGLEKYIEGV